MKTALAWASFVTLLCITVGALFLHATNPPDTSCDERRDALLAMDTCLDSQSCLISMTEVERLVRLKRQCPSLQSAR